METTRGAIREAIAGGPQRAIQAMQTEAEIRANPPLRADRLLARWQDLDRQRMEFYRSSDRRVDASGPLRPAWSAMGKSLGRDPQVGSLLRLSRPGVGVPVDMGRDVGPSMVEHLGLGRGRGLGLLEEDNMAEFSEIAETIQQPTRHPSVRGFYAKRSLLRRAVTGLYCGSIHYRNTPDYTETLFPISRMVSSIGKRLVALAEIPAFRATRPATGAIR